MISIFKRRNPEELKPLTEEDIQRKLYGSYIGSNGVGAKHGKGGKKGLAEKMEQRPAVALRQLPRVEDPEAGGIETEARDLFEVRTAEKPLPIKSSRESSKDVLSELTETLRKKEQARSGSLSSPTQQVGEAPSPATFSTSWEEDLWAGLEGVADIARSLPWGWIAGAVALVVVGIVGWNAVQWSSREIKDLRQAAVAAKSAVTPAPSSRPTTVAEGKKEIQPAPSIPLPRYAIQVCVYESLAQTRARVDQLSQQGLDAFYDSSQTKKGKTVYRLYVGRFESATEAQTQLQKLQTAKSLRSFPDSFVKKLAR